MHATQLHPYMRSCCPSTAVGKKCSLKRNTIACATNISSIGGAEQEAHAVTEQRAAAAEKSVRAIQRELADLEAAVRAQAGQDASRAQAAADQQLAVMRAELKARRSSESRQGNCALQAGDTCIWIGTAAGACCSSIAASNIAHNITDSAFRCSYCQVVRDAV